MAAADEKREVGGVKGVSGREEWTKTSRLVTTQFKVAVTVLDARARRQ
jgi:hypothetical protein